MHRYSVFTNSCVNVPVDPLSKMPKTVNERADNIVFDQSSVDSSTTCSVSGNYVDAEKLKDFYRSIPDYSDINHLTETEFYFTLKRLREKKKIMLGVTADCINDSVPFNSQLMSKINNEVSISKNSKSYSKKSSRDEGVFVKNNKKTSEVSIANRIPLPKNTRKSSENNIDSRNTKDFDIKNINEEDTKNKMLCVKSISKIERPKRNHSACSITWQDDKILKKNEIDQKFDKFFEDDIILKNNETYKTRSMPSSPIRTRKLNSNYRRHNLTIPKPFKMTERDEENRMVNELRGLQRSFSEDMLNQKRTKKQFRANPVPIESRIPLYDKILEDQAMRLRAITKINSEAELRAQMKPFNFTKREENGSDVCSRALNVLPKPKKKKRFRARPIPKNLFSNYFYDKMKEDNFFRSMNRRIRAEEMLRHSCCPGVTGRDLSRISTPAAHSDLPTDPSPAALSNSSLHKYRSPSPTKTKKNPKHWKDDFITTSPQPFHFNTAERANKKMSQITKKIYDDIQTSSSIKNTEGVSDTTRAYSALDLKGIATGRSNLAALLRAEAVKRKFELETARRLAEQRRWAETRQRDRLLRSKPAWHLVKNNHEEDIAMRLQTRRDEERMRREEYFHEMELMYGRVQRQPMLFERYYAPRTDATPVDCLPRSPRKSFSKRRSKEKKKLYNSSPSPSPELHAESLKYLNQKYYDDDLANS